MRSLRVVPALLLVFCAGCSTIPQTSNVYSGKYFYNFEFAYLTPDGQDTEWCIAGDMSGAQQGGHSGTSHVVVQGNLGPPGKYGNLGACKRVLTVIKLIAVSNNQGQQ